ncbi:MAG: tetratricopeptide repeat protein [Candidatus Omnitrophica bacterium]|nr:tetratricopeptide repeat protein [Candidatus Omnitrophota bacterium]
MSNKSIILLSSAFLFFCFSSFAEGLELKFDKDTKEPILVEEDKSGQLGVDKEKEDHITTEKMPGDQYLERYVSLVNEAVGYIGHGQYEQAIEKLKIAITLEPAMPYAYDNLANAYYHSHSYKEAIEMSENALKADPDYANAYGNLGNIYYALGKYQEAKENYQKARKLFQEKQDPAAIAKIDESLAKPLLE